MWIQLRLSTVFLKMIKIVYFKLCVFLNHNPTLGLDREIRRGFRGESPGRLHGRGDFWVRQGWGKHRWVWGIQQRLGAFGLCLPDSQDPAEIQLRSPAHSRPPWSPHRCSTPQGNKHWPGLKKHLLYVPRPTYFMTSGHPCSSGASVLPSVQSEGYPEFLPVLTGNNLWEWGKVGGTSDLPRRAPGHYWWKEQESEAAVLELPWWSSG